VVTALLAVMIGGPNWWILRQARHRIHTSIATIPARDVAVVLGTAPTLAAGKWKNPFFEKRMDAAAELYGQRKVRHFLVSGDNGRKSYDEPTAMRDALITRGVPATAITIDYAGFRTLDTMARAYTVFGQRQVLIVTDDFHMARSLFLAHAHGLDAVGFCSEPVPWKWSKKPRLRELASRVKAWLDVYVIRTKPKFYGPRIEIEIARAN